MRPPFSFYTKSPRKTGIFLKNCRVQIACAGRLTNPGPYRPQIPRLTAKIFSSTATLISSVVSQKLITMYHEFCTQTAHRIYRLGHSHEQARGLVVFFAYSMALVCALMGCLNVPSRMKNFLNRGCTVRAAGGTYPIPCFAPSGLGQR